MERTDAGSKPTMLTLHDLPGAPDAHELAGTAFGGLPFSVIVVHSRPGAGPRVHRHPYAELFVVESGEGTFRLGDEEVVVADRRILIAHPNVPHGFRNTGTSELRLIAIHGAPDFDTEWLEGHDPVWSTRP
jgi:mannose-6-phosphate isomerase-like protein (cupin superfamily)